MMNINYKGMDANYKYRVVEINFDNTSQKLYDKIEKVMNIKGWKLTQVTDGYALCEIDSYEEYKEFVRDYKEVKKSAKLWIKFGM